jgi:hypothetical protein
MYAGIDRAKSQTAKLLTLSQMRAELAAELADLERAGASYFDGCERRPGISADDPRLLLVRSLLALIDACRTDYKVGRRLQPRLWPERARS